MATMTDVACSSLFPIFTLPPEGVQSIAVSMSACMSVFSCLKSRTSKLHEILVHGEVTSIFVVSVCLSVCLFVCLFEVFLSQSAVFDPISIKLGHMLYVWV